MLLLEEMCSTIVTAQAKLPKKQHGFHIWIANCKFSTLMVILVQINYILGILITIYHCFGVLCQCYGPGNITQ